MIDNVGESFGYVFKDPRWPSKVGMGALFLLLSFLFVGIPFMLGYMVWISRNVIRREPYPLPEWTHFGEMFTTGIKLVACYLIYLVPFWIICILPFFLTFFSVIISGYWQSIPWVMVFYPLIIIGSICYSVFWPAIYLRFVMSDKIGETFSVSEIWKFTKKNIYLVIFTILLIYVANLIGSAGTLILFVGMFFTYPYAMMITAHLMGKLHLQVMKENNS